MKVIVCESMEGPVHINVDQIAYYRDLYGNPGNAKIEIFMNCQRDGRIVIEGRANDLTKIIAEMKG